MKFEFGWGAGIATTLLLAGGITLVKGEFAARERERQGVARCASQCKIAGLCGFDPQTQACRPRTSTDCAASDVCKSNGMCHLEEGVCAVTSDDDCRTSEQCKASGRCRWSRNAAIACVPGGPEDCKASQVCERLGRCSMRGDACQVVSSEDCSKSEACVRFGQCTAASREMSDGTVVLCAAVTNDDCVRGDACTSQKMCTAVDGMCR
jgi:hypothetical protein